MVFVIALNRYVIAVPIRINLTVLPFFLFEIKYTKTAHKTAQINAPAEIAACEAPNRLAPSRIASEAPNAAAFEIPTVKGLTNGFLVNACITVPETDKPAPAITARKILGRRSW